MVERGGWTGSCHASCGRINGRDINYFLIGTKKHVAVFSTLMLSHQANSLGATSVTFSSARHLDVASTLRLAPVTGGSAGK